MDNPLKDTSTTPRPRAVKIRCIDGAGAAQLLSSAAALSDAPPCMATAVALPDVAPSAVGVASSAAGGRCARKPKMPVAWAAGGAPSGAAAAAMEEEGAPGPKRERRLVRGERGAGGAPGELGKTSLRAAAGAGDAGEKRTPRGRFQSGAPKEGDFAEISPMPLGESRAGGAGRDGDAGEAANNESAGAV